MRCHPIISLYRGIVKDKMVEVISHFCLYRLRLSGNSLKAGPTLCTYLYNQAVFRHVSVADAHHHQGRQRHTTKHTAV